MLRDWPLYRTLLRIPNVRTLALTQFLTSLIFYSTVIVAFEQSRGLDYTQMFLLESALAAAILLFEVPTGLLADRWGYRRMLILGQGLFAMGSLLYVFAYGFWMFALASFLYGIGLACLSGCDSAMLYESLPPDDRERLGTAGFSLTGAAASAGFFCGLTAGSFLGSVSLVLPVAATAVPMVLAWLVSFRLRPVDAAPDPSSEETPTSLSMLGSAFQLIRREPALAGLRVLSSASFAIINAVLWYNQPFFARAGIPVLWFGPLTAAAMAMRTLVAVQAPQAERRLGARGTVVVACLVPGLAWVALAGVQAPVGVALLVAAVVAGGSWGGPVISKLVNSRIDNGARATTLSALSLLGNIMGLGLNPLIGWAGDLGLSYAGLGLGGAMLLLAGAAFFLVRKPT